VRPRLSRAGLALAAANAAPAISAVGPLRFPGVLKRTGRPAAVALTFDDGPHPQGTPAVMAELDRLGARATFFLVGREARKHPALVAELVAAGHEVAVHGDRHLPHLAMPPWWVSRDLARGTETVERAAGVPAQSLRAPFGAASLATVAFARSRGLTLTSWTRWGRDWERGATPDAIAARLTRGLAGGDILLLHDSDAYAAAGSWRATAAALPRVGEALAAAGLRAAPLCELTSAPT
jgi:peptidoglycan/xylan/chitin deacetylase (PgdA/CDA1 family)